jgi:superfamily II DNA or RNA helicase/CRISPR/Cas system-associated exonuclease Cas4 (RecB family)
MTSTDKPLSYSQIKLFKTCQMKYYYRYVLKVPEQPNKYLHFGSLVHALLELHFKNEPVDADKLVSEYPLSEDVGGYERAKQLAANGIAATSLLNVRDVEHKFFMSIGPHYFVGYADIITADDVIVDWKTGKYTRAKEAEYREQTQYYAYLFWRKYNRLPKACALCFVEESKLIEYTFTSDDVLRIEKEILYYGALITKLQRETAARQQSACMAYGTRCAYYDACHALTETLSVQIDIHGNMCQLNGHVPDLLSQGIDKTLSYDLKDKYWIQKRMQTKYGGLRPRNWEDIGRKKLYVKGTRTFNVGHLPLVKNLLRQFAEYKKIHLDIKCIDHRAPPVSLGIMPAALNTDKVLRPYQTEAINTFLGVGNGYLELATGCVDKDTEFMTKHGWKKISEYQDGDSVLQFDIDGSAQFVKPLEYIKKPCQTFYHFETKYGLNQTLSPEHKVLVRNNLNKQWELMTAATMKSIHEKKVRGLDRGWPTSFKFQSESSVDLMDDELRLMCAVIADGHFPTQSNRVAIRILKNRKIERLGKLLEKTKKQYRVHECQGYKIFTFDAPLRLKVFTDYFYSCSPDQLKIIAEEVVYWDGDCENEYYTTIKESADFVQFCWSACGYRASLSTQDRIGQKRGIYTRKSLEYNVTKTERNFPTLENSVDRNVITEIPSPDGYKYCFTVPSGFLVLRKNDHVFVTGNSGKTIVTAEIIRQMDLRTLWVIDRKELLVQTRELFKQWLNFPIGQIGAGVSDPRDVTVATIQSLVKNINEHRAYLDSVQFVVIDESHHAAAESYQKLFRYLPNTKNRLGCTGTVKRDDGNEMILESLIGPVLYRVSAAQLIADGYLERPSIIFHTLPEHDDDTSYDSYAESYEDTIVQNVERNALGASFVNGQTLIIVKKINHGEIMAKLLPSAVFIHGSTQDEIRTTAFKAFQDAQIPVLIGTIQIFSEGIDVPNLATIINLAGQSGEVKTIQMLGRLLRRSLGKTGCVLHDFCDTGKYGRKASKNRIKTLKNEGHEVEIQA